MKRFALLTILVAQLIVASTALAQSDSDKTLDQKSFDTTVRPQDDLYQFVNGTWLAETEIPADKSNYGAFTKLADLSQKRCREMIETLSTQQHPDGSDAQKVGAFYKSFMDVDTANEKGIAPLQDELEKINALEDTASMINHLAHLTTIGVDVPLGLYVSQDAKNSTAYAVHFIQNGLTLPDRDYYLKHDKKTLKAQLALLDFAETIFAAAEIEGGEAAAVAVLAIEAKMAKASWPRVRIRNANERYNKFTKDQFNEIVPEVDAAAWMKLLGTRRGLGCGSRWFWRIG
jgi:predicted metalloendopeptidase